MNRGDIVLLQSKTTDDALTGSVMSVDSEDILVRIDIANGIWRFDPKTKESVNYRITE